MEMTTNIETIGPVLAAEWLKKNTKNRPFSPMIVHQYASAIGRGEWALNGEPIIFDEDGVLSDGQHRLAGVVKANRAINALVVRGAPAESFKTLNSGKKRNAADVLSIQGWKNAFVVASATRAIIVLLAGNYRDGKEMFTNVHIEETANNYPNLHALGAKYAGSALKGFMPSAFVGIIALASVRHGEEKMMKFFDAVDTGIGLEEDNPAYQLREKFLSRKHGTSINIQHALQLMVKCTNAYIQGRSIQKLWIHPKEKFPELA